MTTSPTRSAGIGGGLVFRVWRLQPYLLVPGRRCGVAGHPTAYAALAGGVTARAPITIPFSAPWGALAVVVMALRLRIQQLRASRSTPPVSAGTRPPRGGVR